MFYAKMFLLMLLLHLFADFTLQGWFANGKQRSWWMEMCEKLGFSFGPYKYDYICALIGHAVYWTLITFAPIIFLANWSSVFDFAVFVIAQTAIHAWVDDLKANRFKLNLIADQLLHIGQIIIGVLALSHLEF
jgi:hypothetical protein